MQPTDEDALIRRLVTPASVIWGTTDPSLAAARRGRHASYETVHTLMTLRAPLSAETSLRRALAILVAVVALGCRDHAIDGPGLPSHASILVAPRLQPAAAASGSIFIALREVRATLTPLDGGAAMTVNAGFVRDTATLAFDVLFPGPTQRYALALAAIDSGGDTLFRSTRELVVGAGSSATVQETLRYVAADTAATIISLAPVDTMVVGLDTLAIAAKGFDAQRNPVTPLHVGWSSSDSTLATVLSNGSSSARIVGRDVDRVVWIAARTWTGVADSVAIRVVARVAAVRIVPDSLVLLAGDSARFGAVLLGAKGDTLNGHAVSWASLDPKLASVAPGAGTVSALAPGTVAVTASSGAITDTAWVRVVAQAVAVVRTSVSPKTVHLLGIGDSAQLVAQSYAADSSLAPGHYSWSVHGGVGIVSVDSLGRVGALAVGSAWVVATEQKGTADSAQVTVDPLAAVGLSAPATGAAAHSGRAMSGFSTTVGGTPHAFGESVRSSSTPILRGCQCPRSLTTAPSATSSGARVKSASATRIRSRWRSWTSSR